MGLQVPEFHHPSFDMGLDYKVNRPQHCHTTPTYPSSLHRVSQKMVSLDKGNEACDWRLSPKSYRERRKDLISGVRPCIETRGEQTMQRVDL